jgi:hypothetical protein
MIAAALEEALAAREPDGPTPAEVMAETIKGVGELLSKQQAPQVIFQAGAIDATTKIEDGAMQVDATTTIQEGAVKVDAPTTIADGAVRVDASHTIEEGAVKVEQPKRGAVKVEKDENGDVRLVPETDEKES